MKRHILYPEYSAKTIDSFKKYWEEENMDYSLLPAFKNMYIYIITTGYKKNKEIEPVPG